MNNSQYLNYRTHEEGNDWPEFFIFGGLSLYIVATISMHIWRRIWIKKLQAGSKVTKLDFILGTVATWLLFFPLITLLLAVFLFAAAIGSYGSSEEPAVFVTFPFIVLLMAWLAWLLSMEITRKTIKKYHTKKRPSRSGASSINN